MAFLEDEALLVYATIKELEAQGVDVDYIRKIGEQVLARFGTNEAQIDELLEVIKAGATYPLTAE